MCAIIWKLPLEQSGVRGQPELSSIQESDKVLHQPLLCASPRIWLPLQAAAAVLPVSALRSLERPR
eukprot:12869027-Alexandrium_andersonii.AAC.1